MYKIAYFPSWYRIMNWVFLLKRKPNWILYSKVTFNSIPIKPNYGQNPSVWTVNIDKEKLNQSFNE